MPKTEIDYSNTIIYKITCKDKTITDVYVGHTTNFVQRKHAHKQSCINIKSANHKCKLYVVIRANGGWINWTMEIINFYNCIDQCDARKREQEYFISLNATLNSIEPFPKPKNRNKKEISMPLKLSKNCICESCNYTCKKHGDLKKHLATRKHAESQHGDKKDTSGLAVPKCATCNKQYKTKSGLWKHAKKCKEVIIEEKPEPEIKTLMNLIVGLMKGNTEMIEVCKKINNS
jgi:hypothetical protein